MASVVSLLRGAAVYSTSNILNALIPFLLLPILTRVLLPSDYGLLAIFVALLGILGAFTGLSVHGAVNVRYVDRAEIDYSRYVGSCFFVLLISTGLTLLIIILFQDFFSSITSLSISWLVVAVIVSGMNFVIQIRLGIWMMQKKPLAYGVFQVLLSLVNMGLSLWFVLLLKQGYEGRLWGQVLATICFALVGFVSLWRGGWLDLRPVARYVREALAFGVPLMPHVIGAFMANLADRFIINEKLGLAAAGIYMVAAQIGMGLGLLADAFNKAFTPWIYEQLSHYDKSDRKKIVKLTWGFFLFMLVVAGLVALLSDYIIYLVAGPEYEDASEVLPWLALGQAFVGMYYLVASYVFFYRKTAILAWVTLMTGAVGVIMTWQLTPMWGIKGAGISFATAMFLQFVMTWFLAQKICPMQWRYWRSAP